MSGELKNALAKQQPVPNKAGTSKQREVIEALQKLGFTCFSADKNGVVTLKKECCWANHV